MAIKTQSRNYWIRRLEAQERAQLRRGARFYNEMSQEYLRAAGNIEREIRSWYSRYATATGMSLSDARKLLKSDELDLFRMQVEDYIKLGRENAVSKKWMTQLEAASARAHISRLEALQLQMLQQAELMYAKELYGLADLSKGIYATGFYKTAYELQKGMGVGRQIQKLNPNVLEKVISKPWTPDGKTFSARIWGDQDRLIGELNKEITQMLMRGEAPDRAIANIAKKFNTSKANAGRLIMTESAYFASAGQKDAFRELGVQDYEFVATLDEKTCEICGGLDGKVASMSEFVAGSTAPPLHAHCRCTTVPYFDDMNNWGAQRLARDENGQWYEVPGEMTYDEWVKEFVEKEAPDEVKALLPVNADSNLFKKVGSTHYMAMHEIIEGAPDIGRRIWSKYESELSMADPTFTGPPVYKPLDGGVYLNIESVSRITNTDTAYNIAFHEFGHNIDWISQRKLNSPYFYSYSYKNNIFGETLINETKNHIASIEKILKAEYKAKGLTYSKSRAYAQFAYEIDSLPALERGAVSDIVSGTTRNKSNVSFGHTTGYWEGSPARLPAEGFANMYAALIANGAELQHIQKYYPESYKIFIEILESLLEE